MTKRQYLCLQRRSRPEQSDQRQPNQAANISHQPRASPNSTPLASRIEFPTMTGLSRKDRKVLEACCRSPVTLQRDLKRARIVLLAAAGRSTRSIAKEGGGQPRIVS